MKQFFNTGFEFSSDTRHSKFRASPGQQCCELKKQAEESGENKAVFTGQNNRNTNTPSDTVEYRSVYLRSLSQAREESSRMAVSSVSVMPVLKVRLEKLVSRRPGYRTQKEPAPEIKKQLILD